VTFGIGVIDIHLLAKQKDLFSQIGVYAERRGALIGD